MDTTTSLPFFRSFNIKKVGLKHLYVLLQQGHGKNGHSNALCLPRQYEDVHANPDSDCYLLQVSTLNFIFIPVVMGMTLTLVSTTYLKHTSKPPCVSKWRIAHLPFSLTLDGLVRVQSLWRFKEVWRFWPGT